MKKPIKEIHKGDFKTLLLIYDVRKLWKSEPLWLAVIFSLFLSVLTIQVDLLLILKFIVDTGYKIIPSILGLVFAAFGIILSVSGSNQISSMIDNDISDFMNEKKIGISTFQRILAVISWAIIIQSLFLIFLILMDFTLIFNLKFIFNNLFVFHLFNYFIFFLFSVLFFYSILLIPKTLLNLFHYGQLINFVAILDKISKINKSKNELP